MASFPKVPKTASKSPENGRFRLPHYRSTHRLQGTPANIRINHILAETSHCAFALHLCLWQYGPIFIQIFVAGSENACIFNFLLVINSNLSPILPRFRDNAGFLRRTATPTPIPPKFWLRSLGLDWWAKVLWRSASRCHAVTLCMCMFAEPACITSTACRICLGGEGNALYPMLSSIDLHKLWEDAYPLSHEYILIC